MGDGEWATQAIKVLIWRCLLAIAADFDGMALEWRR